MTAENWQMPWMTRASVLTALRRASHLHPSRPLLKVAEDGEQGIGRGFLQVGAGVQVDALRSPAVALDRSRMLAVAGLMEALLGLVQVLVLTHDRTSLQTCSV
jgi:hypothetical protein